MTKPQEVLRFKRKRLSKEEVERICEEHIREVGRPSKMDDPKYVAWVCKEVVKLGGEGCSPMQISARIDVDRQRMDYWATIHPEFCEALKRAKQLEQSWWEDQGHKNLYNRDFNANLWLKSAIYRFKEYAQISTQHKLELSGQATIEVNHNVLMDTTRRVLQILQDAAEGGEVIEGEATELLPPPEK